MRGALLRVGAALALFVALLGWALSSPVGSSPDDDYHLSSIWCSQFSSLYPCSTVPGEDGGNSYLAPTMTIEAHVCYAFQPDVTADCVAEEAGTLRLTDRLNQEQGLYPSGFYTVMSVLSSEDVTSSVVRMRVFNALLASALLLTFLLIGRSAVVRSGLLALPVIVVPLGLFLFASTNPSSWTILGCTFYFLFAINAFTSRPYSVQWWLSLAFAFVSFLLALVSRVDGAVFIAVVTLAVFLLMGWRRLREEWVVAVALAVVGVLAVVVFLVQGSGPAGAPERIGDSKYIGGLLVTNLVEVPGYLAGIVGAAPLGWADTQMPGLVSTAGLVAFAAIAFWGLSVMDRRKVVASTFLIIAAFGIPVVFAQQQRIEVLEFVQARYLLPLLAVLLLTLSLVPPRFGKRLLPQGPHWVVTGILAVAGPVALWVNYRRYAVGADEPLWGRAIDESWAGIVPGVSGPVIMMGMIATAAFIVILAVIYRLPMLESMDTRDCASREGDDRDSAKVG